MPVDFLHFRQKHESDLQFIKFVEAVFHSQFLEFIYTENNQNRAELEVKRTFAQSDEEQLNLKQ